MGLNIVTECGLARWCHHPAGLPGGLLFSAPWLMWGLEAGGHAVAKDKHRKNSVTVAAFSDQKWRHSRNGLTYLFKLIITFKRDFAF